MDSLLQEIAALPKVLGGFIYSGNKRVISSNMPAIFDKNTINTMGTLLARSKQMSSKAQLSITAIDIRYNEVVIVTRPLRQHSILVVICEPGTNRPLLDMMINMVIKDIEKSLNSGSQTVPQTGSVPEDDATLRPSIEKIKEALADAIGPIAEPIFDDCYEQWSGQGPESKKRLADLAWLICKEIGDEGLESSFMESIKAYL